MPIKDLLGSLLEKRGFAGIKEYNVEGRKKQKIKIYVWNARIHVRKKTNNDSIWYDFWRERIRWKLQPS
jgi:hypothetical protein